MTMIRTNLTTIMPKQIVMQNKSACTFKHMCKLFFGYKQTCHFPSTLQPISQ